ncbi:MAG: DUF4870 domain-containing protein, partial [Phycisphaerales bacterium]|nr:DUF4870 domain-containing protein [Phycisphaerales bacterium]
MPQAAHTEQYRTPPVNERGRAYDPDVTDDERTYALMLHLSLLAHAVLTFIALAIPIIMWQVKKEQSPFLDDHGREAVNFQISLIIWSIALPIIAALIGLLTCGVGLILLVPAALLPYVIGVIGMIQAAVAANRGEFYRYPM